MSSLSIGIVGLPNVGKSTLFNALLKRQAALAANYPFATIEPNIGMVDVPDHRLEELCKMVVNDYGRGSEGREIPEKVTSAVVKFYDIAGLVKGASKGEGLGNAFLGHIREVNAIAHVVRFFSDDNVIRSGSVDPESDKDTVNTELILADIQSLENIIGKLERETRGNSGKETKIKYEAAKKILDGKIFEVREQFKKNIFSVQLAEYNTENWDRFQNQFSTFNNSIQNGMLSFEIKNKNEQNILLSELMKVGKIRSFDEKIPSMNEVFINAVSQNYQAV